MRLLTAPGTFKGVSQLMEKPALVVLCRWNEGNYQSDQFPATFQKAFEDGRTFPNLGNKYQKLLPECFYGSEKNL
jgi:hypothetical protein